MKFFLLALALLSPLAHAETENALVDAARKEKHLSISGNQMITNKVVIEAFRAKYPFLRLNIIDFDAINAKYRFFQLFESEQNDERGDVVLRALDKDIEDWIAHGWLAKLDDLPGYATRTNPDEKSPFYAFYVGMTHGLAYNPKLIAEKDLPKSYDELLDPKWKGRFVLRSPLKGISVATFASYIKHTRGLEWFRKLGANHPYIVQDYLDQHRVIQQGKYAFALTRDLEVASYALQLWQDRKVKSVIKYATMKDEIPYQYMLAGVNSHAFHPAAARLFVNFLISPEAATLLEKEGYSAGKLRKEALAHKGAWQWDMSEAKTMYEYQSYVARSLRLLRDGGARIEPVYHYGRPAIE